MSGAPANSRTPKEVAERRAQAPHPSMFVRILVRATMLRRGRALSALFAMVVASGVATALLNLYVDVQAKLRTEFRDYGANVVVVARDNGRNAEVQSLSSTLPANTIEVIEAAMGGKTLAVPFAYAVARTPEGRSVVVVGTDFVRARQLDHWWNVTHWPTPQILAYLVDGATSTAAVPVQALVGMRAAEVVTPSRQPFDLTFQGRTIHLVPTGLLQTGAGEDSRVYLDQSAFKNWTGIDPTAIEVAANGTPDEVSAGMKRLAAALPGAEVRPVRQIMEGEANVLNKTRATLYASATLVILTSALCVLATLIGWVFDRRRDFAIMKAMGASGRWINTFFAAEAAVLGAAGAILGFLVGIGVAAWIGRVNFHESVAPRFGVFPYVLAGSVAIALMAAVLPIGLLRGVQPAIILRGE